MLIAAFHKTSAPLARFPLFTLGFRSYGKTESGYKYKTPKLRMRCIQPIYPPPGLNLQIPQTLTPEKYLKQIGGDCGEYADKFENINQIFNFTTVKIKFIDSLV